MISRFWGSFKFGSVKWRRCFRMIFVTWMIIPTWFTSNWNQSYRISSKWNPCISMQNLTQIPRWMSLKNWYYPRVPAGAVNFVELKHWSGIYSIYSKSQTIKMASSMASPRRDSPGGPGLVVPPTSARKSRDETLMDKIGTLARKKKVKEGRRAWYELRWEGK